jgi:acyl-CoA synthetase (AMP-forming)/AMP-acid ligase II
MSFLLNHPSVTAEHLKSLQYILVAAAPVGVALIEKFKQKAPHVVVREGWGMSETRYLLSIVYKYCT